MRDFNRRRILLDTNILLDVVSLDRPESKAARDVLRRCNGGGDMGVVAPTSLSDAYYILRKQYGEHKARALVRALMDIVVILPLSHEECGLSLYSDEPDFEDGLVRAAAELNEVDFILTRDTDAFARSRVRSLTCSEYLALFQHA